MSAAVPEPDHPVLRIAALKIDSVEWRPFME